MTTFSIHREFDELRAEVGERMTQQYRAGVAEGVRRSRAWVAAATFGILALGVALGVVLTVSCIGAFA